MSTPNQFRIQADFAIQATAEGDAPTQPTFEIEAYSGGAIRQWWSRNPMVVDLAGMVAQTPMPLLYGHSGDGGFTGQPLDGVKQAFGFVVERPPGTGGHAVQAVDGRLACQ